MKKTLLLLAVAAISVFVMAGAALAATTEIIVFEKVPMSYLALDAKKLPDNSEVTLRGYIVEKLPSGKYIFEDSTTYLRVEVPDEFYPTLVDKIITVENIPEGTVKEYRITHDTFVDPDQRVQIVGRIVHDSDGAMLHTESIRRIR